MGSFRKENITKHIYKWAKKALPHLSQTEREALEAGDTWWDAELFTGNPDWDKLLKFPAAKLSQEEQDFINGPVEELCNMVDEWDINWKRKDLPPEVWEFLKKNGFFAMIIPKAFGGLEFSAYANSEIIRKIASRSFVTAVTVMVPNSLGPGELLMQYGTDEQRNYWLPRLSDGREIPCFALTSPEAGSDAAAMIDEGIVCKGMYEGQEVLGIRLNWRKRYTTLAPIATVIGLAFKMYDPDKLLGDKNELGITVALVPATLPGITIGNRHVPCLQMFQNGPHQGKDVFIPMSFIIGGQERIGQGWKMLMKCLAAGRGISLPSLSAAGTALSARATGAYANIRRQFNVPIGKFECVQEGLAKMAAASYTVDAARRLTCAALDEGYKPAVISAIMKYHATYMMRESVNDAMDIHGGKTVVDGPSNYLNDMYRAIPIGITVEGANILTRGLIIFGQGSVRCHPWLLKEILSLEEPDQQKSLEDFDKSFWGHVGHSIKTLFRAYTRTWTFGLISPVPSNVSPKVKCYYKHLGRYAASFALLSDMTFLTMGGALKYKEMISARLGDILSELYLVSAVLKRWEDEGRIEEDLPLVKYSIERSFATIENRYSAVLTNLPSRVTACLVKILAMPFGICAKGPNDRTMRDCAEIIQHPSAQRDRLTPNLFNGQKSAIAKLDATLALVERTDAIREKMKKAKIKNTDEALKKSVINEAEHTQMKEAEKAIAEIIAVDDFRVEEVLKS